MQRATLLVQFGDGGDERVRRNLSDKIDREMDSVYRIMSRSEKLIRTWPTEIPFDQWCDIHSLYLWELIRTRTDLWVGRRSYAECAIHFRRTLQSHYNMVERLKAHVERLRESHPQLFERSAGYDWFP